MRIFIADAGTENKRELSAAARRLLDIAALECWGIRQPCVVKKPGGKPVFANEKGKFLSLSHSGTMVMAGLDGGDLGVDIQRRRPLRTGTESRLCDEQMLKDFDFFEVWTLRESIFKLTGLGSLRTMPLKRENGRIICPFDDVFCRLYHLEGGYTAAAASYFDDFPDELELRRLELKR